MPNLIGPSFDQVPTNGMLGGLAYQSPENATIRNLELTNLSGHSSVVAGTATDVFVYDTRKDSDGGQWRKRTQHTSWYNETLNTPIRGARREFPAVAILVLESSRLTIYDADDPDMPMWMIFNTTDGSMLRSGVMTSIVMMNGEFWVGHDSGSGLHWISFLRDTARWLTSSSSYGGFFKKGSIIFRNDSGANYDNNVGGASDIIIAGSSVKDIAITTLPNAPVNSITGLPVPTVAVATSDGISVIRDDGTVISRSHSYGDSMRIDIDNGLLLATHNGRSGGQNAEIINLLTLTQVGDGEPSPIHADNSVGTNENDYGYGINSGANYMPFQLPEFGSTKSPILSGLDLYFGQNFLVHMHEQRESPANTMSNFITTSYNTGWMHGNCKGAWLSDTSTASVTGAELHPNGNWDFSSTNVSYISNTSSGTATVVSGQLVLSGGTAFYSDHILSVSTVPGKRYVISIDYVSNSAGGPIGMYVNGSYLAEANDGAGYVARATGRTLVFYFTADDTTESIDLVTAGSASNTHTFDNWSIREVESDRSVNNKGLAIYGTITKSPVATGSNLVAYSGFGPGNYLSQPYNSAVTYGTNDFYVTFWYYNAVDDEINVQKNTGGADGWRIVPGNPAGDFYIVNGNFTAYSAAAGLCPFNTWVHWTVIRRYSLGVWQVYRNGALVWTTAGGGTASGNFTDTGSFRLDNQTTSTLNRIALVRTGQSVPSPEQIRKIYEDEKALFQPNSQCTLFGSSNAVTAMAYDDTTSLLHVGTSSGRSVFQGLERVANTALPVATTISVSNGLVAED